MNNKRRILTLKEALELSIEHWHGMLNSSKVDAYHEVADRNGVIVPKYSVACFLCTYNRVERTHICLECLNWGDRSNYNITGTYQFECCIFVKSPYYPWGCEDFDDLKGCHPDNKSELLKLRTEIILRVLLFFYESWDTKYKKYFPIQAKKMERKVKALYSFADFYNISVEQWILNFYCN